MAGKLSRPYPPIIDGQKHVNISMSIAKPLQQITDNWKFGGQCCFPHCLYIGGFIWWSQPSDNATFFHYSVHIPWSRKPIWGGCRGCINLHTYWIKSNSCCCFHWCCTAIRFLCSIRVATYPHRKRSKLPHPPIFCSHDNWSTLHQVIFTVHKYTSHTKIISEFLSWEQVTKYKSHSKLSHNLLEQQVPKSKLRCRNFIPFYFTGQSWSIHRARLSHKKQERAWLCETKHDLQEMHFVHSNLSMEVIIVMWYSA